MLTKSLQAAGNITPSDLTTMEERVSNHPEKQVSITDPDSERVFILQVSFIFTVNINNNHHQLMY